MDRSMDSARWQRLDELFDAALLRAPEAREEFLAAACAGDEPLLAELRELLAAHAASGVLDRPGPTLPPRLGGSDSLGATSGTATVATGLRSDEATASDLLAPGARLGPYE